jgi:hypothetical protein
MWLLTSGIGLYGVNRHIQKKLQFGDHILWFPKGIKW